jgi:hypothetical protein
MLLLLVKNESDAKLERFIKQLLALGVKTPGVEEAGFARDLAALPEGNRTEFMAMFDEDQIMTLHYDARAEQFPHLVVERGAEEGDKRFATRVAKLIK